MVLLSNMALFKNFLTKVNWRVWDNGTRNFSRLWEIIFQRCRTSNFRGFYGIILPLIVKILIYIDTSQINRIMYICEKYSKKNYFLNVCTLSQYWLGKQIKFQLKSAIILKIKQTPTGAKDLSHEGPAWLYYICILSGCKFIANLTEDTVFFTYKMKDDLLYCKTWFCTCAS